MTRRLLALDPGTTRTAWVNFVDGAPCEHGIDSNEVVLSDVIPARAAGETLAIEMVASYGMAVGAEVFETVFWSGRFVQAYGGPFVRVYRREVKLHLCGSPRANDANIRAALIDRFGGKAGAIGTKKTPGPLYGIKLHEWAALAVGITAMETKGREVAA